MNGYLVPPGDAAMLAKRLSDILSDPDIEAMGQRAKAFAQQFFSSDAYAEGYRKLLEMAVATSHIPSASLSRDGE